MRRGIVVMTEYAKRGTSQRLTPLGLTPNARAVNDTRAAAAVMAASLMVNESEARQLFVDGSLQQAPESANVTSLSLRLSPLFRNA